MQLIKENIQPLADDLMSYCQKHLGYKSSPSLHFQEDEQNSMNPLGRTAHYSPDENKVVVYVTGRHVKDVLRSLAHELVHHLQNTRGEFDNAHETGPGYAQKDGHMRNMEKEAYLLGNLLFRDWEDQKKLQESKQMKKSKLEEMVRKVLMEKIKNPGKYKTGMKAGYDKDGDGVPNGADKAPEDGSVKEQEELEEGGAANRQGNEDKDQGRERMLPDRLKEEEEVDEVKTGGVSGKRGAAFGGVQDVTARMKKLDDEPEVEVTPSGTKITTPKINKMNEEEVDEIKTGGLKSSGIKGVYDVSDRFKDDEEVEVTPSGTKIKTVKPRKMNEEEEEVDEGTAIARDRMAAKKGQGVKTADLGKKGPAPTATSRLKKEYEDKFADIEATSRLHETKQDRLNKRLMEWCIK